MLADRIALMMDGELLQYDVPRAFYDQPRMLKVARFFRNENFLAGRKRGIMVDTAHGPICAPRAASVDDGTVLVTVRPEHTRISSTPGPNTVSAVVSATTFMGTYVRVESLVGETPWIAACPPYCMPDVGATVELFLPESHVWLMPAGDL